MEIRRCNQADWEVELNMPADSRINDRTFLSTGKAEIFPREMEAEAEKKATSRAAAKQAAALAADRAARVQWANQAAGAAGSPAGVSISSAGGGIPDEGAYDFGGGGAYGDGGRSSVGGRSGECWSLPGMKCAT